MKWVGINLFENDAEKSGPRRIETLWSNLDQYLDDGFIAVYLCYIASISKQRVVFVDPLAASLEHVEFTQCSVINSCFNYDANVDTEIILIPIHFPGHWGIVIYDSAFSCAFYLDSLPHSPSRLDADSAGKRRIRTIISEIIPSISMDDNIGILSLDHNVTCQNDGVSCGYFIVLYAEAWIFNNRNLKLDLMNINNEKRRILWHINELYSNDAITYHSRY